jgi:hypothetical protein
MAQTPGDELVCTVDAEATARPAPGLLRPQVDLSGRGFHRDTTWPQGVAAAPVLDAWRTDIGFKGFYRLQYNLWEIGELAKAQSAQETLLSNYENIIKSVADDGGIVIVSLFGTPPGMGRVRDKRSPPVDPRAYKALVKRTIQYLSCEKKYPVWYEVWGAPDVDEFFLGRKQDYLLLYRMVGEAVKELEAQYRMQIPLGGPGTSWWFQNFESNTVATPERSLIYQLIQYCFHYRLPLDFISWHAYSSDPLAEQAQTAYRKNTVDLIRAWLTYFRFNARLPLVVDEWNYDAAANILPERGERSYVAASFIPARLKGMREAGIDHATYFALEDFQNNVDGVVRNVGLFSFEPGTAAYRGAAKATYTAMRMLHALGEREIPQTWKTPDENIGMLATKSGDEVRLLLYYYIDPDAAMNYLNRVMGSLSDGERKIMVVAMRNRRLERFLNKEIPLTALRPTRRLGQLLRKAAELRENGVRNQTRSRTVKIRIKNFKSAATIERYDLDSSCSINCPFIPAAQSQHALAPELEYEVTLKSYSLALVVVRASAPVAEATQ